MQKARRHRSEDRLRPLVSVRFQVLFTSLIGELFTIQSPYWFTIGRRGVFSLGGWAPQLHTEFHELRATLVRLGSACSGYRAFTFCGRAFQPVHCYVADTTLAPTTPARRPVWAVARSLAATDAIEVSFVSCWYLDVSLPSVRLDTLCIQVPIPLRVGFPIRISQDRSLFASSPGLIAGYHVLHRLSTPRHSPYALSSFITPTSARPTDASPATASRSGSGTRGGNETGATRRPLHGGRRPGFDGRRSRRSIRASTSFSTRDDSVPHSRATPESFTCQRANPNRALWLVPPAASTRTAPWGGGPFASGEPRSVAGVSIVSNRCPGGFPRPWKAGVKRGGKVAPNVVRRPHLVPRYAPFLVATPLRRCRFEPAEHFAPLRRQLTPLAGPPAAWRGHALLPGRRGQSGRTEQSMCIQPIEGPG